MRRLLLLLLLMASPALASDFPARVVGVSDGDTLTVLTAEKRQVKIRLHGVDGPETSQDFGSRAKQAASDLAFGKTVTIRERDKDRDGHTVAEAILPDGRLLNHEMVGQGLSWWYRQYAPNDLELSRLEAEATAAKRGLRSVPGAVPPWDWRRGDGVPVTAGVIGNQNSMVYRSSNCRSIGRMSEKNKVSFDSAEKAMAAGYRKAEDCR